MACSFAILWRNYPAKIVVILLGLPGNFLSAGFIDAFPEVARVLTSRVFFSCGVIVLVLYLACASLDIARMDDIDISVFGWWSTTVKSVAAGASASALLFTVKNMLMSFLHPGSLSTTKSDVVSVKLDTCVLRLLVKAHDLFVAVSGPRNATIRHERKVRDAQAERPHELARYYSDLLAVSEATRAKAFKPVLP